MTRELLAELNRDVWDRFLGRFRPFSRKSGGRWRMAVDYDSDDGATLDDTHWSAAAPLPALD